MMRGRIFFLLAVAFCTWSSRASAKHLHPEQWYQQQWCADHAGQTEVTMPDGTRCDCVTDTHAIEFDFASKWAEAIGQSLLYAQQTGKKAGIVLILEDDHDTSHWLRLGGVIQDYELPIETWKMH